MTATRALILCLFALGISIGGLLFLATQSHAQSRPACGDLATMVDRLQEKYGEVVVWSGTRKINDAVVRTFLFQSPANTWTIIAAQGTTGCILMTGDGGTQVIAGRDA